MWTNFVVDDNHISYVNGEALYYSVQKLKINPDVYSGTLHKHFNVAKE